MELEKAIKALTAAGAVFALPSVRKRALGLADVGLRLAVSEGWVREHLEEFPHRFRLPGGGRNGGEWRIPERDLDAFEERRRVIQS